MSYLHRQMETVAWLFKTCCGSIINLHVNNSVGPSLSPQIGNSRCKRMTLYLLPQPCCQPLNTSTRLQCCKPQHITLLSACDVNGRGFYTQEQSCIFSLIIYNPTTNRTNSILIWLKGRQIKLKLKRPFQRHTVQGSRFVYSSHNKLYRV